jgi:hypothetical protein
MVHTFPDIPDIVSQPLFQVTDVEVPVGIAVNVIAVPLGKFALHVEGQLMPAGLLVIVPVPPDEMPTTRSGEPPEPVMQVTFAVAVPTVAEPRDALLGLLKTVAEIPMFVPQKFGCEVAKPG